MNSKLGGSLAILFANLIFMAGNASAVPTWAESFGATSVYNDGTVEDASVYGPGYDTPVGIAQMPDGGVVVAGQLDLPELGSAAHAGSNADPALVRYAPDGNILWQILLRSSDSSLEPLTIDRVAADGQGNIFICGGKGGGFPYVAKFNSSGALIWKNGIPCVGADCANEFGTMGLTADGGVFVGGSQYQNGNSHAVPAVAKFNSDGSLAFYAPYQYPQQYNLTAAVCQSHDGTKYAFLVQPAGGGFAAVLLNSAGDILAQVTYPRDGEAPIQILATPDGGYVTLSKLGDGAGYLRGGVAVHKLNADLSEQFEKVFTRIIHSGEGLFEGTSIALTNDGGFLIGGRTPVDYRPYKAALVKLNSNGDLQFVSVLGGAKDDAISAGSSWGGYAPMAAIEMGDGGYSFTAATLSFAAPPNASYGKPDWWIVKTDANRKVQDFGGVMADLSLSLFTSADSTRAATNITDFRRISPFGRNTSNQPALVLEDISKNTGVNKPTVLVQGAPLPPAPAHGGLSGVTFFVNDSPSPSNGVADTVLRFRALQTGTPGDMSVRVQATTTPGVEVSWTYLTNASAGRMVYDVATGQFVLNSNDYPTQQADPVYFRAVASAAGYSDSISNVVGPFNLTSNKPRIGSTALHFTGNGPIADFYFRVVESATPSGIAVRVQATTTPVDEATWSDLNNSHSGVMTQSIDPSQFLLLMNNYPATTGIYFRAVASASGFVDSISNVVGPYDLTQSVPPVVSITPPAGLPNGGSGASPASPILVAEGTFGVSASAQTNRALKKLALQLDGQTKFELNDGSKHLDYFLGGIPVGDHVLEAVAVDDLGARGRASTGATYIRVVPAPNALKAAHLDGRGATSAAASTGKSFTAVQSAGFWNSPSMWKDQNGNNGVPGPNDLAIVGNSSVGFAQGDDIKVQSISINGGELNGTGITQTLTVSGIMTINSGSIDGVNIIISEGAELSLLNATDVTFGAGGGGVVGAIYNHGTINLHGAAGIRGMKVFQNVGAVNWLPAIQAPQNASIDPNAAIRILEADSFTNGGIISGNLTHLIGSDSAGLIGSDSAGLIGHDSSSLVAAGGGNVIAAGGGNVVSAGGGNIFGSNTAGVVSAGGGNCIAAGGGNFRALTSVRADSAPAGFTQSGGEINLNAFNIIGPVTVNGGTVTGSGFIQGNLTNNGGYILPGHSSGAIGVLGNFTQGANGTLVIENGEPSPFQFEQLQVSGAANLNGKLDVRLINGYTPDPADTFSPLGYSSASGSFTSVSSNAQITVTSNGVLTAVNPNVPGPSTGQPLNIATRMSVQSGDNVLIAGFIVTGPSGSTKKVLIRGLGPSLAQFGVPGTLSDPLLELHIGNTVITNDNWQQGDTSQIPSGFAPGDSREAVIVATLSPGNYSAVVKGAHGETGVGIAELYDLDSSSPAKLANISTRGFINTGDEVMIGGFIVGGTEPAKILVRAIGPTLTDFGVQGALADPTLELHDSNGMMISNDDWRETQESEIIATTIPPNKNQEPAILATLVPGNYTAVVRGKNNTTGVGLVEAYNLQ
jgi:hypothetical protein